MILTFPRAARAFFNWLIWVFLSFCRDTSVICIWSALIFLSLSTSVAYILKFYILWMWYFLARTSTAILSSFISVFFISNKAFPSSRSLCRNSLSKRNIRALNWSFFVLKMNQCPRSLYTFLIRFQSKFLPFVLLAFSNQIQVYHSLFSVGWLLFSVLKFLFLLFEAHHKVILLEVVQMVWIRDVKIGFG